MGPIAYSLCQKPVIGLVMWITSLCGFPPLVDNEPISLLQAGTKTAMTFNVSIEKRYLLELTFRFASAQARLDDRVVGFASDRACGEIGRPEDIVGDDASEPGRRMPFEVTVKRTSDQSVVLQKVFGSLCEGPHTTTEKFGEIGWLELTPGEYTLEVINLRAQPGLERVETRISLVAGHGK